MRKKNKNKGRKGAEEVDYKFREEDMRIYLYIIKCIHTKHKMTFIY